MKTTTALLFLLATAAHAQLFTFYTFSGVSNNTYTTDTGDTGLNWTAAGGTYPGVQVNSPSALIHKSSSGLPDVYILVSDSYDGNYHLTSWRVGKVNPANGVVTTIFQTDWAGVIPLANSVFAGRWFVDSLGVVHATIPVDIDSNFSTFSVYETHALNVDLTAWSLPVLINSCGGLSCYDPQVRQIGTTLYMNTAINVGGGSGGSGKDTCLWSSSTLLSGWSKVTCASDGGSIWAAFTASQYEGANFFNNTNASTWVGYAEAIFLGHFMQTTNCNTYSYSLCTLTTLTTWAAPANRAGTIIRTPINLSGLAASTAVAN